MPDRVDPNRTRLGLPGGGEAASEGAGAAPLALPTVADRSGSMWSSPLARTSLGLLPRVVAGRGLRRLSPFEGLGEKAPPRGLGDAPQTLSITGASHLRGLWS
mmetsp:Transcript_1247/g.2447  ORF Transcript_1247/g.2447 Transcript_1247/m.2447 type:complete len:103 (+) Transcript_1247:144-452(+)